MTNIRLLNFLFAGMLSTATAFGQDTASLVPACFESRDGAAIQRLLDPKSSRKCRIEAIATLRSQVDERSVDALTRSMDLSPDEPVAKPEGFARYGGNKKLLGAYPAAESLVSMAKENSALVIYRLRATLRDEQLSSLALRNGAFALFLIHIDDPSQAIRVLKQEATATASEERRTALIEAARFWSERCAYEKNGACRAAILEN